MLCSEKTTIQLPPNIPNTIRKHNFGKSALAAGTIFSIAQDELYMSWWHREHPN